MVILMMFAENRVAAFDIGDISVWRPSISGPNFATEVYILTLVGTYVTGPARCDGLRALLGKNVRVGVK